MEVRPSLIILLVFSALTWAIAGDTWGPDSVGSTPSRPPVVVAGRVSPSPRPSPGGIQYVAVDSLGAVLTNITTAGLSSLLTADQDSSGGTQTGAIVGIAVPASGGAVQVPGDTNGLVVQGIVDHDVAASGNGKPLQVSGWSHATGSLPSAVSANGDVTRLLVDRYGRARVALEASDGAALTTAAGVITQGYQGPNNDVASNPVIQGYTSQDTLPSAVGADGRVVRASATRTGQLRTIQDINANAVGYDAFRTVALTNVSLQVKSSAGICGPLRAGNPNSQGVWLHVYNTANASVTVGTTTPLCSYYIPANGTIETPGPITHSTAITLAVTNTSGGTEAPGTNLTVSGGYK